MENAFLITPLLTIKEVGQYLNVHHATVYRWAKKGQIPMFMVGGRWRARSEDIQKIGLVEKAPVVRIVFPRTEAE